MSISCWPYSLVQSLDCRITLLTPGFGYNKLMYIHVELTIYNNQGVRCGPLFILAWWTDNLFSFFQLDNFIFQPCRIFQNISFTNMFSICFFSEGHATKTVQHSRPVFFSSFQYVFCAKLFSFRVFSG